MHVNLQNKLKLCLQMEAATTLGSNATITAGAVAVAAAAATATKPAASQTLIYNGPI